MDKNNNKKGKEKLLLWRGIVDFTNLLFWEELDAVFLLIDKVQNSPLKFRLMDWGFHEKKKKKRKRKKKEKKKKKKRKEGASASMTKKKEDKQ